MFILKLARRLFAVVILSLAQPALAPAANPAASATSSSFSWVGQGVMTPVRDQGTAKNCWAIAAKFADVGKTFGLNALNIAIVRISAIGTPYLATNSSARKR